MLPHRPPISRRKVLSERIFVFISTITNLISPWIACSYSKESFSPVYHKISVGIALRILRLFILQRDFVVKILSETRCQIRRPYAAIILGLPEYKSTVLTEGDEYSPRFDYLTSFRSILISLYRWNYSSSWRKKLFWETLIPLWKTIPAFHKPIINHFRCPTVVAEPQLIVLEHANFESFWLVSKKCLYSLVAF